MPQIIPGGRPRSSSDGDILDEGLCGTLFVNVNDRNSTERPRKSGNVFINNNTSTNNLNSSDDAFDSDSKLSSQSQSSSRLGRKGLTFKSMKKAVSRVFVKDSKFSDSTVKKYEKSSQASGLLKVWTPDLRHLSERGSSKSSSSELSYTGTLSTTRPLITNSNFGMAVPKWKSTPGAVGIYNHGNNCFMNAVLQCLSNTDSFTEYFIRDFFKNDLKSSTSGKKGVFRSSHGEVTEQLGNFLKCLWSGKYSSEVSKEFKAVVGKFNNQYKGDDQHDAQEFLLWLLDRIHEDVSTFTRKKGKPQKVPSVKTDKDLAAEAALVNGESFILKLFQALHSSTLTCPTCGERSSTFDPYLCVSLPLPQRSLRVIYVIVVYLDFQDYQEVKMAFVLNQNDRVRELRESVATDSKIPLKQLLIVQLKEDSFGETYNDEQHLCDIPENEVVYAIEAHPDNTTMHNSTQEFDSPTSQVLLIHVEVTDKSSRRYRFASPAMLKVRRDITWKNLQMEILKKMEDSICEGIFSKTQKLSSLFLLKVYDGGSCKSYLPFDAEMPLYSQCAERAYTKKNEDMGPSHIKIIVEWDTETKSRVVLDDQEHIENSPSVAKVQNSSPGQGNVSLEECLRLYTQEEKLIGDDAWLCPHCKQQQQGTIKTLGLWSLPEVLVLHMKRFKQTGPRRSKLNTLIDFPIDNLDMSSHLSHQSHGHPLKGDHYIYDLMGVSNHYGNMMGGHYTAYCRNPIDGKWREYNDATIRILEGPVATKEAYILFYQRRSLSKNVNQRLFAGDHWIYSLSLAPSEKTGKDSSSSKSTNVSLESSLSPRNSRSRSASPSTRRQNNKGWNKHCLPTYSLTPQPVRRSVMSYTNGKDLDDDSSSTSSPSLQNGKFNQRSRSLQRQPSDYLSQFRREAPARDSSNIRLKDHTRAHINKSPDHDKENFVADHGRKTIKPNPKSTISTSQPHSGSRATDVDKSPPIPVNRHDQPSFGVSSSKTSSHNTSLNSSILKSQSINPSTSCAANVLQMKHNNRNVNHVPKLYQDSPSLSDPENAGKKFADIIQEDFMSRACVRIDEAEDKSNSVRKDSRRSGTQNSLDIAKPKQLNKDNLDDEVATQATDHILISDINSRNNEFRHNNLNTYSVRVDHRDAGTQLEENYTANSELSWEQAAQSELQLKMQNETQAPKFRKPSEKNFGGTNGLLEHSKGKHTSRFADDTAIWNKETVSPHVKSNLSRPSKSATISRNYNTSQAGRFERTSIPHSSTDHDIHYRNSSLGPPPSPTPPHSLREERTFNHAAILSSLPSSTSDYFTSSNLTSRETHSIHSYESARQHSNYQNRLISTGIRTLPRHIPGTRESRYNFRPPREVSVVKTEQARGNLGNISTPCLRESSV